VILSLIHQLILNGISCDTDLKVDRISTEQIEEQHAKNEELDESNNRLTTQPMSTMEILPSSTNNDRTIIHPDINSNRAMTDIPGKARILTAAEQIIGSCPSTMFRQKLEKMKNYENTYSVGFENVDKSKQLEYVDLHISVLNGEEASLRLGSDMELDNRNAVHHDGIAITSIDTPLTYSFTWKYVGASACRSIDYMLSPHELEEE